MPSAFAQDAGRRSELEDSLQARYRLTILGGGPMGVHGENSIRKAGGTVLLMKDGLYGSYDRKKLPSNAIQDGKSSVLSGDKEVELARGEKFYVTAAYVGSDVVTLGLLSTRMISGKSKASQVWCSVNFFFAQDTLAQGDIGKVYSVIDQWVLPEGTTSAPAPSVASPASAPVPVVAPISSRAVELKPGMTRDDVVNAMGTPLQDVEFGDHRWLTYPGISVTLEQGKLTAVERNAQALVPVKISSDPDGADVFLDGTFVSSAPTVLRLHPGTYKVVVKVSGYADWQREVKILPGAEVSLDAKLSK
ncbi:MAG TPA: PEGA domain-containing protein [Terriglobales bacterium]|nr:PEGA domain-containing protein [Terriglobales bacterium]